MELEGQIRQLQQMLQQQKEAEEELVARIGKLQEEKRELQDRLASFQRGLASAEQEKRELERAHVRLEKDKKALRNTLDKVRFEDCKKNNNNNRKLWELFHCETFNGTNGKALP